MVEVEGEREEKKEKKRNSKKKKKRNKKEYLNKMGKKRVLRYFVYCKMVWYN